MCIVMLTSFHVFANIVWTLEHIMPRVKLKRVQSAVLFLGWIPTRVVFVLLVSAHVVAQ